MSTMAMRRNTAESPARTTPESASMSRAVVTFVVAALIAAVVILQLSQTYWDPLPIDYGFLAVATLYMLSVWVTGRMGPLQAAMGVDGRLSTSKFQFLLWTTVVVFTYAWLFAVRAQAGHVHAIDDLPANVLLAMGLSVATLAGAKGITVSYVRSGLLEKPVQEADKAKTSNLVANDNEAPDLTKIQMLVWTFIAIAVYLVQVATLAKGFGQCTVTVGDLPPACRFPDIDAALMVLMGLGQGAYIGNKLVTVSTPRITSVQPAAGRPGTTVKIVGEAFGDTVQTLTLDGTTVPVDAANWKDGEVSFTIPSKQPADGRNWEARQKVQIGMVTGGRRAVGTAEFQILPPTIDAVTPAQGAKGSDVTLKGSAFGSAQGDAQILLDGVASNIQATSWTDTQIQFKLPADRAAGPVKIAVRANGLESAASTFTVTAS